MTQRTLAFCKPEDNLYAVTKMLGHHGGDITYSYLSGVCFIWDPVKRMFPVFGMIGIGVNQLHQLDDGSVHQLGKELCYYTDLESGAVIDVWHNPLTKLDCNVFHIRNHLMNVHWTTALPSIRLGKHHRTEDRLNKESNAPAPLILPWDIQQDRACVVLDAMMKYPNPLTKAEFPEEWAGDTLTANEHMCFSTQLSELEDQTCLSASYTLVLARMGHFLPWMKMGTHPGRVFFRGQGWKLKSDVSGLPPALRSHIETHDPDFLMPPSSWTEERAVSSMEVYAQAMRKKRIEN